MNRDLGGFGVIDVKYFGNGRQSIIGGRSHVVQTKEYHNLEPRGGGKPLPSNKQYTIHGFTDDVDGSFASVRVKANVYVDMPLKVLDYIRPLPVVKPE